MRVTVVATGLGGELGKPAKVVDNTGIAAPTDYRQLDKPAIMRNRQAAGRTPVTAQAKIAEPDMDYLDIPAFLRKQAD